MAFKSATVNASDVPSTQSNFPAYVNLTRLNGGTAMSQAEADSIRVYSDEAKTTELSREIVSVSEMHVKIPSLTSTFTIYVDYDGVRSDYGVTDTYGRNAVWSDYWGVYHHESTNSSTGSNDLSAEGGITAGGTTGKWGSGTDFDGTNDQFTATSIDASTLLTATSWINPDSWVSGQTQIMQQWAPTSRSWMLQEGENDGLGSTNTKLRCFVSSNGSYQSANNIQGSTVITTGVWHKVTLTYSGANTRATLYLNGVQDGQNTSMPSSIFNGTGLTRIGGYSGSVLMFNGQMGETRLQKLERSADWELTEYNNQNDEATFWGTWSDVGGGGPTATFTPIVSMIT